MLCCDFLLAAHYNHAEAAKKSNTESPTRIRSDIIDIKRKSRIIKFINNVVVEKDDSSLLSDEMIVIYDEDNSANDDANKSAAGNGTTIKRIDATGNVKIFSEEFIASGDYGHYDPKRDVFILEKNVIVNNGTSIASGNKFIYNIQTKQSNFVGVKDETSINEKNGSVDKRITVIIGNELKDSKKTKDDKNIKKDKIREENK